MHKQESHVPHAGTVGGVAWSSFNPQIFIPRVIYGGTWGAPPNTVAQQYATVKQTAAEFSHLFTEGALRNLIWRAEAQARGVHPDSRQNGFLAVIHRPGNGRRVLIDRIALAKWLAGSPIQEVNHAQSA